MYMSSYTPYGFFFWKLLVAFCQQFVSHISDVTIHYNGFIWEKVRLIFMEILFWINLKETNLWPLFISTQEFEQAKHSIAIPIFQSPVHCSLEEIKHLFEICQNISPIHKSWSLHLNPEKKLPECARKLLNGERKTFKQKLIPLPRFWASRMWVCVSLGEGVHSNSRTLQELSFFEWCKSNNANVSK